MEDGPGVDIVMDLTEDFARLDDSLDGRRFGTIFCLSVLEHCARPFRMADNLTRLLRPGGWLCIAAPFAWRIHDYPNDLWRFTPDGIRTLFPLVEFHPELCRSATARPGEFGTLDDDLGKVFFSFSRHCRIGHPLRGVSAEFLRLLSRVGLLRWLVGHRHVFAPTTVLMAGQRRDPVEADSPPQDG
jgi:SAM-dependent methyltransferase